MKGIIKKFIDDKGFGFIRTESDTEMFFHISNVKDQSSIAEGVKVKFHTGENEKGAYAKNIIVLSVKLELQFQTVYKNWQGKNKTVKY